jgi:hypothetical protein
VGLRVTERFWKQLAGVSFNLRLDSPSASDSRIHGNSRGAGHVGGPFSAMDILTALFFELCASIRKIRSGRLETDLSSRKGIRIFIDKSHRKRAF